MTEDIFVGKDGKIHVLAMNSSPTDDDRRMVTIAQAAMLADMPLELFDRYRDLGAGPEHVGFIDRSQHKGELLIPPQAKLTGAEYCDIVLDGERVYTIDAIKIWRQLVREGTISLG